MAAVVAAAAGLLVVQVLAEGEDRAVAWGELTAQVGPLAIAGDERLVFRDQAELDRYLSRAGARSAATEIDFSRRQLLLVSPGPRSSTGYAVQVLSVRERGGEITVHVREPTPTIQDRVEPRVTHPYRLLSLPAGPEVKVDWVGR